MRIRKRKELKWVFDPGADAAYLSIDEAPVARTLELATNVMIDFAADGRVLGIEVLEASRTGLSPAVVGQSSK
jgi:uncharacterized protein YuzE